MFFFHLQKIFQKIYKMKKVFSKSPQKKHPENFLDFVWFKNLEARRFFVLKVLGVSALLFGLIYNSIDNFMLIEEDTYCINDKTVTFTKPLNEFFKTHSILKNVIIVYSSMLLDFILVSILYLFIFYAQNYRIFITFILFYALKAILHGVFVMKAPSDLLWEYPGVYSLTFSHFSSSDFFYSGQIGMSTIAFLEFKKRDFKFLKWMSFNSLITQTFVTLILRTNYIIDIVGGFVFAHYFFIICEYLFPEKLNLEQKKKESLNILNGLNKENHNHNDNDCETDEFVDRNSSFSSGGCGSCSCKCKLSDSFDENK